jgi:putative nucleotidyltransferase with HDIG domain
VGLVVIGLSFWQVSASPPGLEWLILAALTLLTGSFTVKLPSLPAKISVSDTFVFTSVLLFGPATGTLTVVLDALVISLWMNRSKRRPLRVLFNATAPAIAIRVASDAFFLLSRASPGHIDRGDIGQLIAPVFAFAFLYFFINTALVAGALAIEQRQSPTRLWLDNFPAVSISYFVGSSIAMLIVAYTDQVDLTVLSIIVPLLLISYLTFRTSMGRLEDANRHVTQLNQLYLSTIETLAMAVDAKDQITHGHIRRVQVYAIELAKRLGMREDDQLQALEAAALLHDMGKLAIPEHILNKPGRLTPAEFEKMKRHSDIGADLLSSIAFPYPVVPIVRHHHENWDGSGYPAGISKTDIPLGARILSVVDCFDALTSDRPYRPRLTPEAAFKVLRERRGTMYDPLVVDEFIAGYPDIAPVAAIAGDQARSLTLDSPDDDTLALRDISDSAAQSSRLAELARDLEQSLNSVDAIAAADQYVRLLTPAHACAFFRHSNDTDLLTCIQATEAAQHLLMGLTVRRGERVTGWVAANESLIANSDATLDLYQIASQFEPALRSAIAAPMLVRGRMVGVLSGYSSKKDAFTSEHRYVFERIAESLANRLDTLADFSGKTVVRFPSAERR